MKRVLFSILFITTLFISSVAFCGVMFTWEPNPKGPTPTGYIVYFGPVDGDYHQFHYNVGNKTSVTGKELNLQPNVTYKIVVRAYNEYGESEDSEAITYTTPSYQPPENVLPEDTVQNNLQPLNLAYQ